jgi:ectoine hydroxylase-related dioxygenase (phytanoyl-CoA dioxygenase family)
LTEHLPDERTSAVRSAEEAVNDFHRDGYALLGPVLSVEHAQELTTLVEARYDDACRMDSDADVLRGGISLMRVFEYDKRFCDLLELQLAIDIAEQVLGKDCHIIAQNALRTPPGRGIINWHIDDALFFPFSAELPGCMQEARLPCYSLTVMIALCEITDASLGPTQVVRGSHRTGRMPEYCPSLPDGIASTSLFARAGEGYVINSQTWHRGRQNTSERTRYLLTTTYGRRFISQRFFPFLNYHMPTHVLDGASPRLLRLLGKHEKGPYG